MLGCDGANSLVRASIGSTMRDLKFEQRWLVVDVATAADLHQWEGVHQVCDPHRAGTYMRIGETRYRWEFRLLDDETAADFDTSRAAATDRPVGRRRGRRAISSWSASPSTRSAPSSPTLAPRQRLPARRRRAPDPAVHRPGHGRGLRDAMNLSWKLAGVLDGELPPDILDSYQQERKPHARSMIRLALVVGGR